MADLLPVEVGLKYTVTVHCAPTASCDGQPLVCENCPGFVPTRLIDVIGRTTVPVFVSVTTWPALVVPTVTLSNDGHKKPRNYAGFDVVTGSVW